MKSIKILPLLLLLFLFSCGKLATTPEDKKSVDEILKFYGGYVETMKGVQTLNGISGDFFEVEIKDSKLINSQPQRAISNAANIAFMVFQNQKPGEYDVVKTKLLLPDGATFTKSFTQKELQEVKEIYPEVDKVNSFLINKDYNGIFEMFDPKFKPKKEVGQRNQLFPFINIAFDRKTKKLLNIEFP